MSTAKSMAAQYKRNAAPIKSGTLLASNRFKSSTSNLATTLNGKPNGSAFNQQDSNGNGRLKSTSMTNLIVGQESEQQAAISASQNGPTRASNAKLTATGSTTRLARPASRNALDSIHNGMNARYASVQSKVLLQNIRPQAGGAGQSKIPGREPATAGKRSPTPSKYAAVGSTKVPNDRTVMINKLKAQAEELEKIEQERDCLRQEVEREKADKLEQVQQLKQELQEKLAEHERQNEEYHQKLLEAYELADQNRRAADTVLNESRQRDEESRKKIEELELQLGELKEFVVMKEEMTNKMFELKEQIRQERERYEEQLKSLHQVFENEKISFSNKSAAFEREFLAANNGGSNYFNRRKGNLQSTESIDAIAHELELRANSPSGRHAAINPTADQISGAKRHRSEHDMMYGSKLSTRMQDKARSAWKVSKRVASSVITGGVGLSACRKRDGSRARGERQVEQQQQQQIPVANIVISTQPALGGCQVQSGDRQQVNEDNEQHTSIVEVTNEQAAKANGCSGIGASQTQASLIRVDENNKLTILTKFAEQPGEYLQSPTASTGANCEPDHGQVSVGSGAAPASERSRCESSSSGRGTSSSDTNSAASQNGDEPPLSPGASETKPELSGHEADGKQSHKGHRRRSSLFKASKVFGGSQVSLNKLKSLFVGGDKSRQLHQAATEASEQQIESSRIRCLELNQAIKMSNIQLDSMQICAGQPDGRTTGCNGHEDKLESERRQHEQQPQQQQIGDSDSVSANQVQNVFVDKRSIEETNNNDVPDDAGAGERVDHPSAILIKQVKVEAAITTSGQQQVNDSTGQTNANASEVKRAQTPAVLALAQ